MQRRPFLKALAIVGICCTAARLRGQPSAKVDFARDIHPILERSCFGCYGPKIQMFGLRLDAKSSALAGGQSGKIILPGNVASSPLYRAWRVSVNGNACPWAGNRSPLPRFLSSGDGSTRAPNGP